MSQEELDEFTDQIRETRKQVESDVELARELIELAEAPLEWEAPAVAKS